MVDIKDMSRLSLTLLIFTFSLIITPVFSGCGPCKNGSCHVGICECRFSWVGDACDEYIFAGISSTYDFFRFFFLALGIIFLAITFTVTIHALKGKAAYYHLIGFILISFDCVVQIAVYGSGVETIEGDWAPYVASFITVLHFGLIYFIYSVYLLWWVEMNDKYKRMEFSMAKRTRTLGTKTSSNSNNSVTIHSNVSAASSGSNSASNDTSTYSTGVQEDTGPTSTATITISPDNNKTNPYLDNVSKEQLNSSTASIGSDAALEPSPPDLEAGKAGEEKRTKNNHSNGEKEQKEAFWYKILPKQISGRTLKWVLWSSCVLVNACNVLRVAIYDVDMTFYVTVILYVVYVTLYTLVFVLELIIFQGVSDGVGLHPCEFPFIQTLI